MRDHAAMTIDQIKRMACDCVGPEYHQTGRAACAISVLLRSVSGDELVDYFRERHQSLTAREIEDAIADIQRANVSAATRSDSVVAKGVTAGETALREMQHAPRVDCEASGAHLCVPLTARRK